MLETQITETNIEAPPKMVELPKTEHFKKPSNLPFYAKDRAKTTLLFGGLTEAHEQLILGHLTGLGYNVEILPCPDFESFQTGKEFCNRAQCNPTYFTIGNLIKHLKLKAKESSVEEIEKNYVFVTAGSCGPCRFGMYEAEYRKAVVDAGFENFRVQIMQQTAGVGQIAYDGERPGLDLNKDFFLGFLQSILIGDCINQMMYKIRPYEIEEGATLRAKKRAMEIVQKALETKSGLYKALHEVKRVFGDIECDYTRIKPKIKVTGEFWASITEGDGNYHLKNWLNEEGGEVLQEPLTGWVEHLLFSREIKARDRRGIEQEARGLGKGANAYKSEAKLFFYRRVLNGVYNFYRSALGFKPDNTVNNRVLAKYADAYYSTRQGGGEAYMEVGNLIHCAKINKVHMMLSVKPFGCMPSTASDGVQSKVMNDYPKIVFLPIETSGDSEVNFKSRVQMKLFEAKQKAKAEAEKVTKEFGIDLEAVEKFVARNPQYRKGDFKVPHRKAAASTGMNFILEMHYRMNTLRGKLRHKVSSALYFAQGML